MSGAAPRFALQVAIYADAAEMRRWMEDAERGAVMVYAVGPLVAGDHASAVLARGWQASGAAELFKVRSGRPHCLDYCARKLADGPPPAAAPANSGAKGGGRESGALLRLLRAKAQRGEPCPSYTELARLLKLPATERGRQRAVYLLRQLRSTGRLSVDRAAGGTITIREN